MVTISPSYISNFKNIFGKLFHFDQPQDTVAVHEWTERHQQLNDPRVSFLEGRIASLEEGVDALAVKSLRSGRFKLIYNLLERGENVVTLNSWDLFHEDKEVYERIGVEIKLAKDGSAATLRSLVNEKTRLIYLETINNHFVNVPDFIKIISYAQLLKIPVVVDNTASVGGYLFAPIKYKANIVIESLEDYLPRTTQLKAVIIDGGNYDWFGRFKKISGKLQFVDLAKGLDHKVEAPASFRLVDYLRKKSSDRYNGYPIPNDPFALVKKLEEIPSKIQKRSDNATLLAKYLKSNKYVASVNYTGLPSGAGYFQALNFFRYGFGHYLTFTLNVPEDAALFFFEELQQHFALRYKLNFDKHSKTAYLSVPAIDYVELKDQFEESFVKLRDYQGLKFAFHNPWLEQIEA